jgi:hypothetical protein
MIAITVAFTLIVLLSAIQTRIIYERIDFLENPRYLQSKLTIKNESGISTLNIDTKMFRIIDFKLFVSTYIFERNSSSMFNYPIISDENRFIFCGFAQRKSTNPALSKVKFLRNVSIFQR